MQALDMTSGLKLATAIVDDLANGYRNTFPITLEELSQELYGYGTAEDKPIYPNPVRLQHCETYYGGFDYVPPPVWIDGHRIDYPFPTGEYGSAQLEWVQ